MKKFNIFNYASKDKYFDGKSISGVYHEDGMMVATDSYVLIAKRGEYKPEYEGKIVTKKGAIIDGKYVNWRYLYDDAMRVYLHGSKYDGSMHEPIDVDLDKIDAIDSAQYDWIQFGSAYYKLEHIKRLAVFMREIKTARLYVHSCINGFAVLDHEFGLISPTSNKSYSFVKNKCYKYEQV